MVQFARKLILIIFLFLIFPLSVLASYEITYMDYFLHLIRANFLFILFFLVIIFSFFASTYIFHFNRRTLLRIISIFAFLAVFVSLVIYSISSSNSLFVEYTFSLELFEVDEVDVFLLNSEREIYTSFNHSKSLDDISRLANYLLNENVKYLCIYSSLFEYYINHEYYYNECGDDCFLFYSPDVEEYLVCQESNFEENREFYMDYENNYRFLILLFFPLDLIVFSNTLLSSDDYNYHISNIEHFVIDLDNNLSNLPFSVDISYDFFELDFSYGVYKNLIQDAYGKSVILLSNFENKKKYFKYLFLVNDIDVSTYDFLEFMQKCNLFYDSGVCSQFVDKLDLVFLRSSKDLLSTDSSVFFFNYVSSFYARIFKNDFYRIYYDFFYNEDYEYSDAAKIIEPMEFDLPFNLSNLNYEGKSFLCFSLYECNYILSFFNKNDILFDSIYYYNLYTYDFSFMPFSERDSKKLDIYFLSIFESNKFLYDDESSFQKYNLICQNDFETCQKIVLDLFQEIYNYEEHALSFLEGKNKEVYKVYYTEE